MVGHSVVTAVTDPFGPQHVAFFRQVKVVALVQACWIAERIEFGSHVHRVKVCVGLGGFEDHGIVRCVGGMKGGCAWLWLGAHVQHFGSGSVALGDL